MSLVNSMTCVENLIDFNSSDYKALSRSLNIQVPFTEAHYLHQEGVLRELPKNVRMIHCQA